LFKVPEIETPLFIMHNDADGAVPWYQGIEFFVALRRLNKPAWLLNYNNEPHWPVKRANRIDFNIRLEQFFDHYLMDKPIPVWMAKGIPAIEKGINYGLEIEDKH
jgi:dipeptidyl aminopeptidase/acylaminoacyl peptidase